MKRNRHLLPSLILSAALLVGSVVYNAMPVFADDAPPAVVIAGSGTTPPAGAAYILASAEPLVSVDQSITLSVRDSENKTVQVENWSITPSGSIVLTPAEDKTSCLLKGTFPSKTVATITATLLAGEGDAPSTVVGTLTVTKGVAPLNEILTNAEANPKFTYSGTAQNWSGYNANLVSKVIYKKIVNNTLTEVSSLRDVGSYSVFLDLKAYSDPANNKNYAAYSNFNPNVLIQISKLNLKADNIDISGVKLPDSFFSVPVGSPTTQPVKTGQTITFKGLSPTAAEQFTADLTYQFPHTQAPGTYTDGAVTVSNIQYKGGAASSNINHELNGSYPLSTSVSYTVAPLTPKSIEVSKQPGKLSYLAGQALDLSGLEVTVTYSDGSKKSVAFANFSDNGLTTVPSNGTILKQEDSGKPISVKLSGANLQAGTANLEVKKSGLSMTVTANPTQITDGGDVKLTVKLEKSDAQAASAFPAASEIKLTSDKNYPVKSALSGANGLYEATFTLPNENNTGTFTAVFAGNGDYSQVTATCTVTTVTTPKDASGVNSYLDQKIGTATDYNKASATEKEAIADRARYAQKCIASLSNSEKSKLKKESLQNLDSLLQAVTGVTPTSNITYASGISKNAQIPDSGVTIVGAVSAVSGVQQGDKIALAVNQKRSDSGDRELLKVDLTLNVTSNSRSAATELQTPVTVTLPLPKNFSSRSNMALRHYKKSGGSEDLAYSIRKDGSQSYLTFTTNSFSTFMLYWRQSSGNAGGGDDVHFDKYTITAKAGTGGTISPTGNVRVEWGDEKTFTVKAEPGYRVSKVLIDGQKQVSLKDGKYTFKDISEPYTIEATFEKIKPDTSSTPSASSKPASSQAKPKPQTPASSRNTLPASSELPPVSLPEPSKPEVSSSEESSEESSEGVSSEESSSSIQTGTTSSDSSGESGEMSDSDLTVAVVIIVVVVALSLTAVFFGIYLYKKRDNDNSDDD